MPKIYTRAIDNLLLEISPCFYSSVISHISWNIVLQIVTRLSTGAREGHRGVRYSVMKTIAYSIQALRF